MIIKNRYLYSVAFALMLFSSSAMAKIPSTAYKGITDFFLKGKEFYSPTVGAAALESGFIENIRFYGPFTAGYDEGERSYIDDTSDDPLWNIVKILFPSNNGQLGVDTGSSSNFASGVTNPKTVALLINLAKDLREEKYKDSKELKKHISKVGKEIFETLEGKTNKKSFMWSTINPLLKVYSSSNASRKKRHLFLPHSYD